jgi:hypothetical protein
MSVFRDAVRRAARDAVLHLGEDVSLPGDVTILGIYREPTQLTEMTRPTGGRMQSGGITVPMDAPMVTVLEDDAALMPRGTVITIRGRPMTVVDLLPTGNGLVRAPLKAAAAANGEHAWR